MGGLELGTAVRLQSPGAPVRRIGDQPALCCVCVSVNHSLGVGHQGLKDPSVARQLICRPLWPVCVRAGAQLWYRLRMLVSKLERIMWFF